MIEKLSSFRNLLFAYYEARRSKQFKNYTLEFSWNLEDNLLSLQNELRFGEYKPKEYRKFIIYEPKRREIKAPVFRDRVVHHSLYKEIEPVFDESFIYDSYACRKCKGTHGAVKRLKLFLKSIKTKKEQEKGKRLQVYCLKCDISKYFASVDHSILFKLILKKIKEKRTTWLIRKIIESSEDKPDKGIPIGNLTSQLFANVYLNELDQFVKHELREKYYIRYMDDFLILGDSKKHLWEVKKAIEEFLESELDLEINPRKIRLFPVDKGIDFLGYVVFENYILLRGSTLKRWKRRFKKVYNKSRKEELIVAWYGYTKYANAYRIFKEMSSGS